VHRGINLSDAPRRLFVVRIKPKDKPLVTEVPAPQQWLCGLAYAHRLGRCVLHQAKGAAASATEQPRSPTE